MARCLIFVRTTLGWEDVGVVRAHFREMDAMLRKVPGYGGGGAWKGVGDVYARLVLYAYESPEAMERGLAATVDMPVLTERLGGTTGAVDVMRVQAERSDGAFAHGVPHDAMICAHVRVAEPGYGPDAVDDLEDEFGGLSMVGGYAGMLVGTRVGLADEVVGLTAWRSAEGLAASRAGSEAAEVTLYEPLEEA